MFGLQEGITATANYFGAERQHDLNMQAARQAEFASAQQAQINRDWQERMSNTGYERATASMKAAGLNPMLAYHQGPAQTGPGATGQGFPSHSSKVESIPMTTAAQIRNLNASTEKAKAEASEIRERTPSHGVEREYTSHRSAEIQQAIAESSMRIEKIIAETGEKTASAAHFNQQVHNLRAALPQIHETVRLLQNQSAEIKQRFGARLPQLQRELGELDRLFRQMETPGRQTDEAYATGAVGNVLRSIGNALRSLNPLLPQTSGSIGTREYERK